jgi:hypothetical protein
MSLDPATFATLINTLGPAGALTQLQASELEQQKQLQQATTQATQDASEAGQQYQQAAAAPVPHPSPLDQFLPSLLGGIASVVSRDPSFRQHAQEQIANQRKDLVQQRVDNLSALKDSWDKKAQMAESAGDLEQTIKARQTSERLTRTMDQLLHGQEGQNALAVQSLRNQGDLAVEKERTRGALAVQNAKPTALTTGLPDGTDENSFVMLQDRPDGTKTPYVDVSQVKGQKLHDTLAAYAKKSGLPLVDTKGQDALTLIGTTRQNIADITSRIIPHLPTGGGFKRAAQGGVKKVEAALQTPGEGSLLAAYPATRTAAISTIQTLASLGKGLRINQAEIQAAQNFDYPKVTDSQETARNKFAILGMMIDHMENTILGKPPSQAEVASVMRAYRNIQSGKPVSLPNNSASQTPARADGKVYVVRKSDGRTGWISPDDPDLKSGLFQRQ